jgi:dethiobiotin synthetase
LRALGLAGRDAIGLKPVESGLDLNLVDGLRLSDARSLASASSLHARLGSEPLYALPQPISPHLAARASGVEISIEAVATWISQIEDQVTPHVMSHMAFWTVIETAGGVFSPLSAAATNFDLAQVLDPAIWVLVAADSLGVLHEVSATLQAMRSRGRTPDHVVLSAARQPDASTGTNAAELRSLGIVATTAVLERDDDRGIDTLVQRLLDDEKSLAR